MRSEMSPTIIISAVETPHIIHPKALPSGAWMPYNNNVCMTKIGKEPMPPGVTIMDKVASVRTENAASIGNVDVPSIPLKPT